MAIWLSRSKNLVFGLRQHLGLSGIRRHVSSRSALTAPLSSTAVLRRPPPPILAGFRRESTAAEKQRDLVNQSDEEDVQELDFPGGKVSYTCELKFMPECASRRVPCYRVLDEGGNVIPLSDFSPVSEELAVKMYGKMATLQMMDNVFYEAQRQGRISFYLTSVGEEAINIASAAALSPDDVVLPQYREPGILLWRGFTLQEFANQCFGNRGDYGKGRQMPIHYGSNRHNYFTVSSPIATQLPQAAGVGYALKMEKKNACAVTFVGDGGTSEGDFHAGLNFAAVMEAPVVFICRNNGYAISTHISEQFRSDGIVVKGQAYGIRSIRVDGNDTLAVYSAVRLAREMAVTEQRPVLIEALTYRVGHHSTSDDSTKYRPADEIQYWKTTRNPVNRFRKWVERNGWWSQEEEDELRGNVRKQLLEAIQVAEKSGKQPLKELFNDVYDVPTENLAEQEVGLRELVGKYPQDYPIGFHASDS
ncbi:PREDICTED: 2-oxoisovalerate dehydrogenase subunit alpha 1, mitochondrial isoform X1 [Tarenaya hassleriana]|uniref:2-oxoisovalerate dehydrogenase subunit alpha 1, mitochondrial isoform X1 n=2 Tax=Tarenaya hassleriana TaxID=28532 RepID=UPI0008FD82A8|nr:PREDICTED: 2-oxoisovalerate dehydrogenase subunit alpha 1, mitochondrial isoform X1 [Tarenaya hassleriana]